MSFSAVVLSVLIASPGDVATARDRIELAIRLWNTDRCRQSKVVLLPVRWETDAVSQLGRGDAQAVINKDLVDTSDIIIGIFHSRLGMPTPRALSGTAEELQRGIDRGIPVHVYFSTMPVPREVDADQLKALNQFRDSLQNQGLLGNFRSEEDLATQVRTALERDVARFTEASTSEVDSSAVASGALLHATYRYEYDRRDDSSDQSLMRTRIEIENLGRVVAENVRLALRSQGEGEAPLHNFDSLAGTHISPHSRASYPVYLTIGTSETWSISITWEEGGRSFTEEQSISTI
jgi:hypothetical protein